MDSTAWLRYFEANRLDRPEPHWDRPSALDPATAAELARSLSHFQLGESGDGTFLLREAARARPDDPGEVAALSLFIAEEQEHARLLERLVLRYGGRLVARHWTDSCFRLVRRAFGVHFEIQVLVSAEMIGTAYYRLLHAETPDPVLVAACELILGDEAEHVRFHAERFRRWQAAWLPLERAGWTLQFEAFFLAAARAAWLDHRRALRTLGVSRRRFLHTARRECAAFLASCAPHGRQAMSRVSVKRLARSAKAAE